MFCKKCGSPLTNGSNFCGICGAAQTDVEKQKMIRSLIEVLHAILSQKARASQPLNTIFCGKCGTRLAKESQICEKCGAPQTESLSNENIAQASKGATDTKDTGKKQTYSEGNWLKDAIAIIMGIYFLYNWIFGGGYPYKNCDEVIKYYNSTIEDTFKETGVGNYKSYKLPDIKDWRKTGADEYTYSSNGTEYEVWSNDTTIGFSAAMSTMHSGNNVSAAVFGNALLLTGDNPKETFQKIYNNRIEGFEGLGRYEYTDANKKIRYTMAEAGPVVKLTILMKKK